MRPDLEWQAGEDAELETLVKTSPRPPSRWRIPAIIIAVSLGVVLGVAYRSIPEPPRPTPIVIAEPNATPRPLEPQVINTIDRESLALADGDLATFMTLQDTSDAAWRQAQLGFFRSWGNPLNEPLYTIVDSGTLSANRLWAEVIQFRAGQYFQQTRFYQLKDQRWQRIAPVTDAAFWGEERSAETPHFVLTFRAQDAHLAADLARRYEAVYGRTCSDFQCSEPGVVPTDRKLQIVLQPADVVPLVKLKNDQLLYTLPSPRLNGLYFSTDQREQPGQDPSLSRSVIESIVYYVARTDVSAIATWPVNTTSQQFLDIIAEWENLRLLGQSDRHIIARPELLANPNLPDLASLWTMPAQFTSQLAELRWVESAALIAFLDEHYGADKVVAFMHLLGQTSSLADTIKQLDLPDHNFEQQWHAWLKQAVSG